MTNFRIILNVIGNLVLAAGLHMDAAGAAIATVTGIILNNCASHSRYFQ
ncbi:hypothetical protein ACTNDS_06365 [Blautia sp. HCP3S3_C12]